MTTTETPAAEDRAATPARVPGRRRLPRRTLPAAGGGGLLAAAGAASWPTLVEPGLTRLVRHACRSRASGGRLVPPEAPATALAGLAAAAPLGAVSVLGNHDWRLARRRPRAGGAGGRRDRRAR